MPPVVTFRSLEPSPAARPRPRSRPIGAGPFPHPPATPTGFYSWACCVFQPYEFIYVYGLSADCDRLTRVHRGTTLNKGPLPSLAVGKQQAEAAAVYLRDIYEDVGSAWAMPVREFLRDRYGLDLDRPGWERGRA